MAHRVSKIAAATAAATALVAGGYALGTSGNGTAAAARPGERSAPGHYGWRGRPGRMQALSTLATKLGVSESALRSALKELRPQRRADRRDAHVTELAKALGISEAKVRAALDKQRAQRMRPAPRRMGPGARQARIAGLAKALGVGEADLSAAIVKVFRAGQQDREQRRDALATALAGKLGIAPAKAKAALADFAAQRPRGGWRGGPGWHRRGHP
jgi:transposase-like protein